MILIAVDKGRIQDAAFHGLSLAEQLNAVGAYSVVEKPQRILLREQTIVNMWRARANSTSSGFVGNIGASLAADALAKLAAMPDELSLTALDAASDVLKDLAMTSAQDETGLSPGAVQSMTNALGVLTAGYAFSVQAVATAAVTSPSPPQEERRNDVRDTD